MDRRNATTRSLRPEVGRLWIRRAFRDWPGAGAALGGCRRGTDEARRRERGSIPEASAVETEGGLLYVPPVAPEQAGGARRPGRLAATARRSPAGASRAGRVALGERRGSRRRWWSICSRRCWRSDWMRSTPFHDARSWSGRWWPGSPTTRRCGTTAAAVCGPTGRRASRRWSSSSTRPSGASSPATGTRQRSTPACSTGARRASGDSPRPRRATGSTCSIGWNTATAIAERATPPRPSCWRWRESSGCASAAA